MKRIITTIAALAMSLAFVTSAQAGKGEKKKGDPEAAWKKIAGDKESVTKEEFTANAKDKAKAEALFDRKDANKDGKLTKEEFMAHGKKK
jgi:Ni/Co efflux regulator RcnB